MCLLLEGDIRAASLSFHRQDSSKSLMIVLSVPTAEALGTIANGKWMKKDAARLEAGY